MPSKPRSNMQARPRKPRPNATDRGYDGAWRKFRKWYAGVHPAICVQCDAAYESARMVLDHEPPLSGPDDPGRLDELRVRWMCIHCHAAKDNQRGHDG